MLTTGSLAGLSSELQGVRGRGFASPGHHKSQSLGGRNDSRERLALRK